jgi:acetyl coenzyme A synthetase (ADP forming)-like protein
MTDIMSISTSALSPASKPASKPASTPVASPVQAAWPGHYACDVVLRNGSTLPLRPIRADDAEALLAFHQHLSSESLHLRFQYSGGTSLAVATRLAVVDYHDSFGLVGECGGMICAAAHYYRHQRAPEKAEVAFAVADALRGQGVGTKLLERLAAIAREHGIRVFTAQVLGENQRMLDVFLQSGFDTRITREAGVANVELHIGATASFDARLADRNEQAAAASMKILFEPRSIAVIGASRNSTRIGGALFRNVWKTGFSGTVYPVHPEAREIDGITAYRTIADVPGTVDMAVIAVPAAQVATVVDECLAKGVRGLVVISAGFGETSDDGRASERAMLDRVRAAGARLVGPNCMGLMNTDPRIGLNASFAPIFPPRGRVALATQSGALGLAMLEYIGRLHFGLSTFVSVGNKLDVSGNDLIQYWAADDRTDVIVLYLESFGNPKNFSTLARRVSRRKPIVALKAGRSHVGARAASSHTGALASNDAMVDALFAHTGVIRANTLQELFDVSTLLAHQPLPNGRRVAIVTNAGGPGILAADAAEAHGIQLAPLSTATVETLRSFLPAAASVSNPVDMLASAPAEHYRRAIAALQADDNVDSILAIFVPPLVTDPNAVAEAIGSAASPGKPAQSDRPDRSDKSDQPGHTKPVLATFVSAAAPPVALSHVPCYAFPESAMAALAHVARYADWRRQPLDEPVRFSDIDEAAVRHVRQVTDGVLARGGGWLTPPEVQSLLDAVGIPTLSARMATTTEDAVAIARELGLPVALKAVGPQILHKSDVGGVRLGLTTEAEVRAAATVMQARLGDKLTGFLVQQMAPGGVEMIAGVLNDPSFGPVLSCGVGGVFVEIAADMAFRLHPLTERDAREMIGELRGARMLRGFRGAEPADEPALRDVLLRLSSLIDACPEIQELDINPLRVLSCGVVAVDARVRIEPHAPAYQARRVLY